MGFGERPAEQTASTSFTANMEVDPTTHQQQVYLSLIRVTFTPEKTKTFALFSAKGKNQKHIYSFPVGRCKYVVLSFVHPRNKVYIQGEPKVLTTLGRSTRDVATNAQKLVGFACKEKRKFHMDKWRFIDERLLPHRPVIFFYRTHMSTSFCDSVDCGAIPRANMQTTQSCQNFWLTLYTEIRKNTRTLHHELHGKCRNISTKTV
jgi:hypothetical protein